jgi:flagellar biosynthesis protein FlhB
MNFLGDGEERPVEASPARRARAIEAGNGPRAPWLASAVSGLIALGLLSLAAGPIAMGARGWLRASLAVDGTPVSASGWRATVLPALGATALILVAVALSHALVHGGWTRLRAWRPASRTPLALRLRSVSAGWILAASAVVGGAVAIVPWIGALPSLVHRPFTDAIWGATLFVGAAALGALLAALMLGFLQLRLALRAFDRTLRMTRSDAQREDRGSSPRMRRGSAGRWRLA